MRINQKIVNEIGCIVARWILHNCDDGLIINRKGGARQIIKVFSEPAYKNVIKPAIHNKGYVIDKFPCKVGDTVYVRALCECITSDNFTECPFADDCKFEECINGNERIFAAVVDCIHNDGKGWYFSLKNLCFEVALSDFGRTAFLTKSQAEVALQQLNEMEV